MTSYQGGEGKTLSYSRTTINMEGMTENHYFHPLIMDSGKNQQWVVQPSVTVSWRTECFLILKLCPSLLFSLQRVEADIDNGEISQTLPYAGDQS